jgi:hypothetical protein
MRFASCVFGKLFAALLLCTQERTETNGATSHYQSAVRNTNQSLLISNPSSREEDYEEPNFCWPAL